MPAQRPLALLIPGLAALIGCATAPAAPRSAAPPAMVAPLPRSSIAAVLAHRGELGLSAEQESKLGEAEADLEVSIDRALRERPAAPAEPRPSPTRATGPSGPPPGAPGAPPMPGMAGSFSGGHANLAPTTGAPPGGGPAAAPARATASAQAQLDKQLDDLDTAAWLRVEPLLTPAQREQAREIAGEYRAARFDARQRQGSGP